MMTFQVYWAVTGVINMVATGLIYKKACEKRPAIKNIPVPIYVFVQILIGFIVVPIFVFLFLRFVGLAIHYKVKYYRLKKEYERRAKEQANLLIAQALVNVIKDLSKQKQEEVQTNNTDKS